MIHTVSGTPSKQPLRYFWRVLAHAFIILLGVAYVFPIYWMLITSFKAPGRLWLGPNILAARVYIGSLQGSLRSVYV